MDLEFTKLVKGSSPIFQVGDLGFFKLSKDTGSGGGGGGDVTFSRTFSENTPAQISAVSALISANNMTSSQVAETYGWNIGDTISYQLTTGENVTMRIIGFNHDDLSDGTGKAGITLDMTHCLATQYRANSKNSTAGYASHQIKTETLPTIKALLPQEWQDVIKLVDKRSGNGSGANYTETLTLSEDLFLLSSVEVLNEAGHSKILDEGVVYEYWNGKVASDRVKNIDKDADGIPETGCMWWLRSVAYLAGYACCIGPTGASTMAPPRNYNGVSFAFCV